MNSYESYELFTIGTIMNPQNTEEIMCKFSQNNYKLKSKLTPEHL